MAAGRKIASPRRGEVYLVTFDPALGAEIQKTRPALVLQNDVANRRSPITIVAAITSHVDPPLYPTEVLLPAGEAGLPRESVVLLNQLRSVDKARLVRRLGAVSPARLTQIDRALRISVGLVDI